MTATFYVGDALEVMATLPEKSVDLVLSSPPFLALRSYLPQDHPDKAKEGGSQPTPGAYIDWLVDVVEACDRVLAPHGSLCFELGDTYAGSGGAGGDYNEDGLRDGQPKFRQKHNYGTKSADGRFHGGGKSIPVKDRPAGGTGWPLAKSLSLIPELFRYTLVYGQNPLTGRQTERWRLRNVIRWVRPNPPVGALGDKFRPATSELMVFCKSAKRFFDLDAVRTDHVDGRTSSQGGSAISAGIPRGFRGDIQSNPAGAPPLDWWKIDAEEGALRIWQCVHHLYKAHWILDPEDEYGGQVCLGGEFLTDQNDPQAPLDWWNIPPGGYQGAHYAVWPPELCVKPIKAMSPEQVCRVCGEPRRRITDVSYEAHGIAAIHNAEPKARADYDLQQRSENAQGMAHGRATKKVETVGFTECRHNDHRPGLVLDPFAGSGTTLAVATGHGRDAIGIDLDARNYDLALERVGPLVLQRGEVAA